MLVVVFSITCATFLWWGASVPSRGGRGGSDGAYGTIYGQKITAEEFNSANNEVRLSFLFRYGQWPERIPDLSKDDIQKQVYAKILINRKAAEMGIHVNDSDVATVASQWLSSPQLAQSLGFKGKSIQFADFLKYVLEPASLTSQDFQNFVRDEFVQEQLMRTLGGSGALITPQEASALYRRENQPISAQAIFFNFSNYLSEVTAPPAAVGQFYTNHLAEYRLPDRVQISYVEFNVTNFMTAAEQKIGKTNLEYQVENIFRQNGIEAVPGAKTPEEAKAGIREALIRREAGAEATAAAKEFAGVLFTNDPPKAENLSLVAKQKGLTVKKTAPFGSQYGPEEFLAPPALIRAAFDMSADAPLAGPIPASEALYIIALDKQLPSEIPSFDSIRSQVTEDYLRDQARAMALKAGTNCVMTLSAQMAAGKTFAAACATAGVSPTALPPFSLSTQQLPELGDRTALNELKQTAFVTPAGHTSGLVQTAEGGFVLYVQSRLPVDTAKMNADLPQFLATIRRERENEAFNVWLNIEAGRQLPELTRKLQAGR